MNTIEKLRAIKGFSGLTQQKIADELGVTLVALNRWLNAKAVPRKNAQEKIANLYSKYFDNGEEKATEDFRIYDSLLKDDFDILTIQVFSEQVLRRLGDRIKQSNRMSQILQGLIINIPILNRDYDWNVGSILQHIDPVKILDVFRQIENLSPYYNSIGLSWVVGELNIKEQRVVDYLQSVVSYAKDSDAWWRAAFSLEKLGIDDGVNLLKRSQKVGQLKDLDFYLNNISDKRSVISILILSNIDNLEKVIYPKTKETFLNSTNPQILTNCCWLIGRLNLIDDEILPKLIKLIEHKNYELKYYTFFALQNNTSEVLRPFFEKALSDDDALIRKLACRSIRSLGNEHSLGFVERALYKEEEEAVISELSKTIYSLKDSMNKRRFALIQKTSKNENGLIVDETDKWYRDAAMYNLFSEAEDPQNVCFDLIREKITNLRIVNPVDLATGTGRMLWQIINKLDFEGVLLGVDMSTNMCDFVQKNLKRERGYTRNVQIIQSSIVELPKKINFKSSFVISSFGFPSKISNKELCLKELKAVYTILSDDGVFVTLGWDEVFNDDLNHMWFKYVPDNIHARNFEEWRRKRSEMISSPRNCGLTWLKKGIHVPLQFPSLKESVVVMSYLFGRDSVRDVIKNSRTEWMMSLGITFNDKKSLKQIIEKYERS